jgi:hypothetical protein
MLLQKFIARTWRAAARAEEAHSLAVWLWPAASGSVVALMPTLWGLAEGLPGPLLFAIAVGTAMSAMALIRYYQCYCIEVRKEKRLAAAIDRWRKMAYDAQNKIDASPNAISTYDHYIIMSRQEGFSEFEALINRELAKHPGAGKVFGFGPYTTYYYAQSPRSSVVDGVLKRIEWLEVLWGLDNNHYYLKVKFN